MIVASRLLVSIPLEAEEIWENHVSQLQGWEYWLKHNAFLQSSANFRCSGETNDLLKTSLLKLPVLMKDWKKKKNSVKGKARKENKPQSMIKHVIHTDRVPWTRWCLLSNSARVGYNVIWKRVNSWCMDCSWIKQQKQAVRISNITPPQKKTVWNSEYLSH